MKPYKIRHSKPLSATIEKIIAAKVLKKGVGETFLAISAHWNKYGNIFPSQEHLAEMNGIDRRTVITHVKKLREIGLVRTIRRPNITIDGIQHRQSMIYVLVENQIGALLNQAKKILRKAAAKIAKKDHLRKAKKDHTNSIPKVIQEKTENTVKKNASRVFLEKRIEALQSELEHLNGLATESAYKAAVKKNRIERGEILSDDEIAMRKALSARTAHIREKSAKVNNTVRSLETALLTWNATKTGFTADMFNELSKFKSMLSTMGNAVYKRYSATL